MRILFLDDNGPRTETFLRAVAINSKDRIYTTKTAEGCISRLEDEEWDYVFLDHDLGDEIFVDSNRPDCGMEVVRWLEANKKNIHCIFVHTANEPARNAMVKKLKAAGYTAVDSCFLHIKWDNLYSNLEEILDCEIE